MTLVWHALPQCGMHCRSVACIASVHYIQCHSQDTKAMAWIRTENLCNIQHCSRACCTENMHCQCHEGGQKWHPVRVLRKYEPGSVEPRFSRSRPHQKTFIRYKDPRADSRFAHSQWEMALLCNDVPHWLGANLKSTLRSYLTRK